MQWFSLNLASKLTKTHIHTCTYTRTAAILYPLRNKLRQGITTSHPNPQRPDRNSPHLNGAIKRQKHNQLHIILRFYSLQFFNIQPFLLHHHLAINYPKIILHALLMSDFGKPFMSFLLTSLFVCLESSKTAKHYIN